MLNNTHTKRQTVHPHGCGEHQPKYTSTRFHFGSSPRVWGTYLKGGQQGIDCRFIPTGVGNIIQLIFKLLSAPVHPHGCGEHPNSHSIGLKQNGSSPRVWGTWFEDQFQAEQVWFIPTGVGNINPDPPFEWRMSVHPHGCGEHFYRLYFSRHGCGSSPRVWGTCNLLNVEGFRTRFIPTGVGNISTPLCWPLWTAVHPHGCGEHNSLPHGSACGTGSSPRVWGT